MKARNTGKYITKPMQGVKIIKGNKKKKKPLQLSVTVANYSFKHDPKQYAFTE